MERRGKAGRLGRAITERYSDSPNYHDEFGHLEADTIQGKKHKGAAMTLVERKTKAVIILNTHHKTDKAIFEEIDALLSAIPKGLFSFKDSVGSGINFNRALISLPYVLRRIALKNVSKNVGMTPNVSEFYKKIVTYGLSSYGVVF